MEGEKISVAETREQQGSAVEMLVQDESGLMERHEGNDIREEALAAATNVARGNYKDTDVFEQHA